jgi:hypothetical protein
MEAPFVNQRFQHIERIIRERVKTPRAAAIAGIIFSVLLTATLVLIRISITSGTQELRDWTTFETKSVVLALSLVPFVGISFLWFIAVVRDRLGIREDRFFATVFFGSGILFLALFFVGGAVAGALIMGLAASHTQMIESGVYFFGRAVIAQIMNVYALKMAGVFMLATATQSVRSGILPPWITLPGYVLAWVLLLSSHFFDWLSLAFPLWVFVLSTYILIENLGRGKPEEISTIQP